MPRRRSGSSQRRVIMPLIAATKRTLAAKGSLQRRLNKRSPKLRWLTSANFTRLREPEGRGDPVSLFLPFVLCFQYSMAHFRVRSLNKE